jgi:segregation and condensation protein A
MRLKQRFVWSLAEARNALEKFAGQALDWTALDPYLMTYCVGREARRAIRASGLAATLEMVLQGNLNVRQDRAFAPIWVKRRSGPHPA